MIQEITLTFIGVGFVTLLLNLILWRHRRRYVGRHRTTKGQK